MALTPSNVKLESQTAFWGVDTAQVMQINCGADVSGSLNNKYFLIYSALNAARYYVWFNINSAGTDPTIAGHVAIAVAAATDASATAIATATAAAITAQAAFGATSSGAQVTVTNAAVGYSAPARDSKTATETGFGFILVTQGIQELEVGLVDAEIELNVSESLLDVTAHQFGTTVVGQLRTGREESSLTMTFKETSAAQVKKALVQQGSGFISETSGATEVFGFGTDKDSTNVLAQASKLRLHPQRLPSTDKSEDWTFWLAYPEIDALTFSGEEVFMLPMNFRLFPDLSKAKAIQIGLKGDSAQTLT